MTDPGISYIIQILWKQNKFYGDMTYGKDTGIAALAAGAPGI